ncbi:hypothetical protein BKH42_03635 [Helicobacter sp. 13S00482-2]|uniref:type IV secretory system conjugative DNA transfer family protein n=1 Tax=Helicobacter sp. 13S00482-2 TaxID=1476200 RepID=UPI000BA6A3FA|nr:TraM recognition domain-containing protein [Helicobacter sp. 13S00482-2]PAF53833.1 hypothetical protein BKH42_03635 [Helicobacter sp. 13S00482-2]
MLFCSLEEKLLKAHNELKDFERKINTKKLDIKKERIKAKKEKLVQKKYDIEEEYITRHNKEGLYVGIGVNLQTLKKEPLLLPWKNFYNHSAIFGTTQVGKTKFLLSFVRQNILKGDNVLIMDPKAGKEHEILNKLFEFVHEADRHKDFSYINPLSPKSTDYFNPLYGLGDDEIASLIATILYPNPQGDGEFYSGNAFAILKVVLYSLSFLEKIGDEDGEYRKKKEKEEYIKYIKLMELRNENLRSYDFKNELMFPDVAEKLFAEMKDFEIEEEGIFNRSFLTFQDLLYYTTVEKLKILKETVFAIPVDKKDFELMRIKKELVLLWEKIDEISPEHRAKISVSLSNFLSNIGTGELGKIFCTIKINPILSKIANPERGLILLLHPFPLKFKKISEFVNKILIKVFESLFGIVSVSGRMLGNKRLWAHLDEGEAAIYPGIESLLNKGAGLGFTINIYTQSLADLESKMGTILAKVSRDSLNTYFVLKMNEEHSIDSMIRAFGIINTTNTNIVGGSRGMGINFSRSTESILNSSSIMNLQPAEGFVKNMGKYWKVNFPIMPDRDSRYLIEPETTEDEKMFRRMIELEKELEKLGEADV